MIEAEHPEEFWAGLLPAALMGVERVAPTLPSEGPIAALLGALPEEDHEGRVLTAAAAIAIYLRAGTLPPRENGALPEPCEPDSLPVCGAAAGERLARMLDGDRREFLPEWLELMAASGRRVRPQELPALLEAGRREVALRPLILPVIGMRGRWVAARNDEWLYAAGNPEEWETGSRAARVEILRDLRVRDPSGAREKLEASWSEEAARDRAAFLELLEMGLSLADEPFIEGRLDDRSVEVRAVAARLLGRLADSRLSQRMRDRVTPLLQWTPPGKGRMLGLKRGTPAELKISLPAELTPDMERDGVRPEPAQRMGKKAWWLEQMLSAVPPSHWSREWGAAPKEILTAAAASDSAGLLQRAWQRSAVAFKDTEWSTALLDAWMDGAKEIDPSGLAAAMDEGELENRILKLLDAGGQSGAAKIFERVEPVMDELPRPWSMKVSQGVLDAMRRRMQEAKGGGLPRETAWVLRLGAAAMPAEMISALRAWMEELPDVPKPLIELEMALQFRADMREELAP